MRQHGRTMALVLALGFLTPGALFAADPVVDDPSNHVALMTHVDLMSPCGLISLRRMSPDGSTEDHEFRVPDGKMLVVTDISWTAKQEPNLFIAGYAVQMFLNTHGPAEEHTLFRSRPVQITEENKGSRLGSSEMLGTGVLVGPNQILCPRAYTLHSSGGAINTVNQANLLGYFVSMKSPQAPNLK